MMARCRFSIKRTAVTVREMLRKQCHNQIVCLTLCIRETPKRVLLQIVKTQMKCSIMLHFIRVYTVCKGKKDLQTKNTIFLTFILIPLCMYNGLSQARKRESISKQMVKATAVHGDYKSANQFGFSSGPAFCLVGSGSNLYAKIYRR